MRESEREGQTEQESYMQLELLQVNHIWLCHICCSNDTRTMHILNLNIKAVCELIEKPKKTTKHNIIK